MGFLPAPAQVVDVSGLAAKLTTVDVVTATGPTTVAANTIVPTSTASNGVALALPDAPADGTRVIIKMIAQGTTNSTGVACSGTDVFNKAGGPTSIDIALVNQSVSLQYAATPKVWYVVSEDQPLLAMDARYYPAHDVSNTVVTAGTSQTLVGNAANVLTLDQASCALTPPAAAVGASFTLVLVQGSGGSKAVTWAVAVDYPNKVTPVLSTAAAAVDVFTGYCYNGSTWMVSPVAVNVGH